MVGPKISWQVADEISANEYVMARNYTEEGSFTSGQYINKKLRVWNNYEGAKDVPNATDCNLVLAFKNYEDNFLLHLIRVKVGKYLYQETECKPMILSVIQEV